MIQGYVRQGDREKPLGRGCMWQEMQNKETGQLVAAVSDGANAATAVAEYLK